MHLYFCSVDQELEPYKNAAGEVARSLGYEPIERAPSDLLGLDPVAACTRQVAQAERVLAIVGRRCGAAPSPEDGGDGLRPWAFWEVRSAFAHRKPVTVLMTGEGRPAESIETVPEVDSASDDTAWDDTSSGKEAIGDLRGELGLLAVRFEPEAEDSGLPAFREQVRRQLGAPGEGAAAELDRVATDRVAIDRVATDARRQELSRGLELRRFPPPELPEQPYPVLLPYTHPRLLAGRELELEELTSSAPLSGLWWGPGQRKGAHGLGLARRALSP